ncbi:hypothetical protein [Paraliobacillus zengyii]|uniref:hypothetical protein n=1 Tax=Paraliobacillus zengyii TaxID=2213194 RepID=UPI000DD330C8|nr:hypothetical protein [Paraliobacillus zengyii]
MAFQSMDVSSILRSASSSKVQQNQMVLRPGQILSGKILEIYPNQRASVQLGNQQFVAQLQTALNLDGEYFFQVQTGNKLVHLKVLTDIPANQTSQNQASALLKQLQLPVTKENLQFVKQLLTSDIPFRPSELKQALQMQQGKGSKGTVLLMDMMRRQLPITSTMYGAMSSEGKQSLNTQLQNLQNILGESVENEPLLNRINALLPDRSKITSQNDLSNVLLRQIKNGDQAIIQLVRQAGITDQQQARSNSSQQMLLTKLTTLAQSQLGLTDQHVEQFQKIVQYSTTNGGTIAPQQLQDLQTFLNEPGTSSKIADSLTGGAKQKFLNWQQQPTLSNLVPLVAALKKVADQQVTKSVESKLTDLLASYSKTNNQVQSNIQNDLSTLLSKQIQNGDQDVIQLVKQAGILSKEINQQQPNGLSSSINNQSAFASLKALFQVQLPLTDTQVYQFQKLVPTNSSETKVSAQLQTFLEQPGVASKIASVLTGEAKQNFINWQQQGSIANSEEVYSDLKRVAEQQLPKNMENKLTDLLAPLSRESGNFSTKEQFLLHAKQFLSFSGLDYEHQLLQENSKNIQQENSLKQLVLQSLQTGHIGKAELESLLQTLNGMQLASVREEAGFLQASMQLPGLFGLEKDVKIDFESKKGEDGQINPDFCRVVFYLSLEKMGDTMIDMSIQKRVVQLTIHNQHEEVASLLDGVKPLLQQGLENNGYQLSTVKYKQLPVEVENNNPILPKKEVQSSLHQGVDYRI